MIDSELITVIIPAYNVEKYIRKCLDSVVTQTYHNLEIILVDDGSTDSTGKICDEYALTDKRIIVIHQKNAGLSTARNTGLDKAAGTWIAFLDSDDWISPEMYETLHALAIMYKADIASCKTHECPLGCLVDPVVDKGDINELTPEQMILGLKTQDVVRFEVWNKLWRRSLIADTRFIQGQVSEDVHFDRILFLRANKMVHINRTMHHYLVNRPGSTLSNFKIGRMCVFEEFKELIEDSKLQYGSDVVACVASIAAGFAMSMYSEARRNNIDRSIISDILNNYKYFHALYKGTIYENHKADKIFSLSPVLYHLLLSLKLKFNK